MLMEKLIMKWYSLPITWWVVTFTCVVRNLIHETQWEYDIEFAILLVRLHLCYVSLFCVFTNVFKVMTDRSSYHFTIIKSTVDLIDWPKSHFIFNCYYCVCLLACKLKMYIVYIMILIVLCRWSLILIYKVLNQLIIIWGTLYLNLFKWQLKYLQSESTPMHACPIQYNNQRTGTMNEVHSLYQFFAMKYITLMKT